MNEKTNIQIENSFTLQFKNTTDSVQQVVLFREGTSTTNDVKDVFSTGQTINQNTPSVPQFTLWATPSNQPYVYFGQPLLTSINQYPTSINDFTMRDTGILVLTSNNRISIVPLIFSSISIPINAGETLEVVNDRINEYIRLYADTTNFKNQYGEVMVANLTIDFSVFQSQSLPISLANFTAPFGVSVQYPAPNDLELNHLGNPTRLSSYDFPVVTSAIGKIEFCALNRTASANGVEISGLNNINYTSIKESQNGSVLGIHSLVQNIGNAPFDFLKDNQLLQPYLFKKIDVNGNEIELSKVQVIDPFQNQYSYSEVKMVNDHERYALDGNTKFEYRVEPQITFNLTFNYLELKNGTFGTKEGESELNKDERNLEQFEEENEYAEVREMKVPTSVNGGSVTKITSKKSKYLIPLLVGSIAFFLFSNLKTNQK